MTYDIVRTVGNKVQVVFKGLVDETKPTQCEGKDLYNGSVFLCIDSMKDSEMYSTDDNAWHKMGA